MFGSALGLVFAKAAFLEGIEVFRAEMNNLQSRFEIGAEVLDRE